MELSQNYKFFLPSSDGDDIVDINQLSDNFRKIDSDAVKKDGEKVLSTNDYTDNDKKLVRNALQPENIDQTYSPTSPNAQSGIAVAEAVSDKQDSLVSGTNIKTINNQSILGSGNIIIEGGSGSSITIDQTFDPDSENAQSGKAVAEAVAPISGDYELIEEFTLTEDTEQIVRNQEPNGKPYAFKNLLVFISLNQTINSTIITRYVFNKNGFQPYAFNSVNYIYFTDNVTPNYAPCTFTVEVRNRNGFYYPITTSAYSNDNIYNAKVREASIFVKDGYVKEIEFTNSTKFMSGAKIRIYGVRA